MKNVNDRILQCISQEKCPHVDSAPKDAVTEIRIHAIHIAAAVGTVDAFKHSLPRTLKIRQSKLFGLTPYFIALLKENEATGTLPVMQQFTDKWQHTLLSFTRLCKTSGTIRFKLMTLSEMSVVKHNVELLKNFLRIMGRQIPDSVAFQRALQYNYTDMIDILIQGRLSYLFQGRYNISKHWCQLALLYDKPDLLDVLLDNIDVEFERKVARKLLKFSNVLKRDLCKAVINKHYDLAYPQILISAEGVRKSCMSLLKLMVTLEDSNIKCELVTSKFEMFPGCAKLCQYRKSLQIDYART